MDGVPNMYGFDSLREVKFVIWVDNRRFDISRGQTILGMIFIPREMYSSRNVRLVIRVGNRRFCISRGLNHTMYDFDSSRDVSLVIRVGNRRFNVSRGQIVW